MFRLSENVLIEEVFLDETDAEILFKGEIKYTEPTHKLSTHKKYVLFTVHQ